MPSNASQPIRGSREWTERVLELIKRDCMDDFEELCELMGLSPNDPADDKSIVLNAQRGS